MATLTCDDTGSSGSVYATYQDPEAGVGFGFAHKFIFAGQQTTITYPSDFAGIPKVITPMMTAQFYKNVVPIDIPTGNYLGWCRSTGT